MTSKTKPKVRFKEYNNNWIFQQFDELFVEYREKTIEENEDILLSCAIDGMFLNSELFSHFRGTSNKGYIKVKKNDLILSAQNLHLGNANVNLRFMHGIISPAYKVYNIVKQDPEFIQAWVKKDDTKNFFLAATTEGASGCRKNVEWKTLGKQLIAVPDINEQKKIGELFKQLDKLISSYQKKYEKLLLIKKQCLKKMFPKNNNSIPEIRFKKHTTAWEEYVFNDLCSIITKQTGFDYSAIIKPSLLNESGDDTYPFIQNKDFDGLNINFDTDFYVPKDIAEDFPKILLDKTSILVSISGKIGNVGLYTSKKRAFIGGAVGICKLLNPNDGHIILYYLMSNSGQKYFSSLIKASSHANITVEDIRNMPIMMPTNPEERILISNFFIKLDNLINLNFNKLQKIKNIKVSLLERMFV